MTFISYSQNLEDVMLWRALKHVDRGFYIDVGAWDPREDSVTLAFYERGWRGIDIEPNADKHSALAVARPGDLVLDVAVSDTAGERVFYDIPTTGLSTLDSGIAGRHRAAGLEVHERTVAVTTLRDICAVHAPQDIHFLKIDVEGLEAAVLAGADFARFRPWLVVIEATEPNSPEPTHAVWEPGLLQSGYSLVYFDGLNRYYAAHEHEAALAPAFSRPPNVFDDYLSAAGIRKALSAQTSEPPVAELMDALDDRQAAGHAQKLAERHAAQQAALEQAAAEKAAVAAEAEKLDAALQEAVAARADAELRALSAERDAQLAQADRERLMERPAADRVPSVPDDPYDQEPSPERRRIYYDASLIIRFGLETPVGLVRTEHYVAEFLARDPALDIRFVIFDAGLGGFRGLARDEAALLRRLLFHRYEQAAAAPAIHWKAEPEPEAPAPLKLAQVPEPEPEPEQEPEPEPEIEPPRPPEPVTARLLLRRLRTASTLPAHTFNTMLIHYAVRLLPVTPHQGLPRRLVVRGTRRIGLHVARGGHSVVYGVTSAVRSALDAGRHLLRPDLHTLTPAARPEPLELEVPALERPVLETPLPDLPAPAELIAPMPPLELEPPTEPEPPPGTIRFRRGSVLLSMGNSWDYLDYAYLHRICRYDGVRYVSVIFDVIAMQYPFSTPSPPHIYHRHWVEIGHSAAHLLAISKFSADQYSDYISEPNGLSPPLSHAYLPSFLRERADEIGEVSVPKLAGRRFAVFCSTIETRKNHQMLLHLWDRLRLEFSPEDLPILVFVGKWGWGTETVRLLSERNYRLRSHLMILDRASDAELIWIYRHARFTLFPALSEGYGLAAAESLSFGTPVVVADCPALIEATEGLMPAHDPLDFMAWMNELRRLIEDDVRLNELRAAAAGYRGPAYEEFADAIRTIALAVSTPQPAKGEPCLAA